MKLNFLYLLTICAFCTSMSAQNVQGSGFVDFASSTELANYGVQKLTAQASIEGSALLFSSSRVSYIRFKNQMRSNTILVNVDQYRNILIVENKNSKFMLPMKFVDSLVILSALDHDIHDEVLVTKKNSDNQTILLKVLVDDEKIKLYKYCKYSLRKPSYNAALDVGNKNYSYLNKDVYLVSNKDDIIEFPLKKSKILKNKELDKRLVNFCKTNTVKLKDEQSIVELITSYSKTL